jgi:predicted permease
METVFQDVRYGIRVLRKSPGFALVAVLTLALGVGVNAAMFGVFNAFLMNPLPFPEANRLTVIWEKRTGMMGSLENRFPVSMDDFRVLQAGSQTLESLTVFVSDVSRLTEASGSKEIEGLQCAANLFGMLGAKAETGRVFMADETRAGAAPVMVLSHAFAVEHFGEPVKALGKVLTVDGKDRAVIGVIQAGFRLPNLNNGGTRFHPEVWLPLDTVADPVPTKMTFKTANVIGRLKPGIEIEQARTEISVLVKGADHSNEPKGLPPLGGVNVLSLAAEDRSPDMPRMLSLFQFAVGFVLLIACANIANLMLARATQRKREIVIRMAIGASRGRLFLQLLTESLTLGLAGSLAGLAFAIWLIRLVNAIAPQDFLQGHEVTLDHRVLLFTMVAGVATSILFGLPPAFSLLRQGLQEALLQGGRTLVQHGNTSRSVLVVVELALALVLLVGAGLMVRTLWMVSHVHAGFRTDHLVAVSINLPLARYHEYESIVAFDDQLLEKVRALPGVESATISGSLPMDVIEIATFRAEGRQGLESAIAVSVRNDYFRTMGIRLLAGRDFGPQELGKSHVVVISQSLANKLWPKQNPLGKRLTFETDAKKPGSGEHTVIGVVEDTHDLGLDSGTTTNLYRSSQVSRPILMVHTNADPSQLGRAVAKLVADMDKEVPLGPVRAMRELVDGSLEERRFQMWVFVAFATLAIALAGIGLYGVLAYVVSMRTREIGIRMALGAQLRDVIRLVVQHGVRLALVGLAIGLAAAVALSRLMASMVFGVKTFDPATLAVTAALMMLVVLAACYLPAIRAARVDPVVALRYE